MPPDLRYIYPASTLAFYLGADMVAGDQPALHTDGDRWPLPDDLAEYHDEVERTLEKVLYADCVVRTEGFYELDVQGGDRFRDALPHAPREVYDMSPAERLEAYMGVPETAVAGPSFDWTLVASVEPKPSVAESLPFVLDSLGVVRTTDTHVASGAKRQYDDRRTDRVPGDVPGDIVVDAESKDRRGHIAPDGPDAIGHTWIGEGHPHGVTKTIVEAFHNRIEREPPEDDITVAVVANGGDTVRTEAHTIDEIYEGLTAGDRITVEKHERVPTDELARILGEDNRVLHYVGHGKAGGLKCPDGVCRGDDVEEVGADVTVLNACAS